MRRLSLSLVLAGLIAAATLALAADLTPDRYEVDGRKSGYLFMTEGSRALQDDDFQNPALFALDRGEQLWNQADGAEGKSCAGCHEITAMAGIAARYPKYDAERGGLVNLELRINDERTRRMKAEPFAYESDDLLALTAFVAHQSRGAPMAVDIDGPARPFFEKGEAFYYQRRGQLDLACDQCHDSLVGQKLRGDVISQGQVNGFPVYRLTWRAMASRHRLFAWCNTSVRAEPYELGSAEYLNLELFTAWRGRGLPIETPAVRR
jgi:sulfur-oxidizing protein SoxA